MGLQELFRWPDRSQKCFLLEEIKSDYRLKLVRVTVLLGISLKGFSWRFGVYPSIKVKDGRAYGTRRRCLRIRE